MKKRAENLVLIMSAGSGTRFGADKPKQYCSMMGKPIIEFAINACKNSICVDDIVIVTSEDYKDEIRNRYGYNTTVGGDSRTISLANGLQFVNDNYYCKNIIIANAVCPLMTPEQIDKYFNLLNEYDYVLTSWKVVSTLHRYDGVCVDRNDYFHVMEPEAYRFQLLYENYKANYPVPYIFHQLPKSAKGYYCFDYPYTMKITYSTDVQIAELLYKNLILGPKEEKIKNKLNIWLSSYLNNSDYISLWMERLPRIIREVVAKWEIISFDMNPIAQANCVFEGVSKKHGDIVVKIHATKESYKNEVTFYSVSQHSYMARIIDLDDDYNAMLIERIKPGLMVKFYEKDCGLIDFYDVVNNEMLPIDKNDTLGFPTIYEDLNKKIQYANQYNFEKRNLDNIALKVYNKFFKGSKDYLLHRDLQRRNLLRYNESIKAIDPLGIVGPKEFEFAISFIIEAKAAASDKVLEVHNRMLDFFSRYCNRETLNMAVFILWVHKLNEYIFTRHDNFALATWTLDTIMKIYPDCNNWKV